MGGTGEVERGNSTIEPLDMATSKLQRYTGKQLRKRFDKYGIVENTRPDWLISSKGERLELDFYLERLGIAVEVQGQQHFEFTPVFHASEYDFQEQVRCDKEKLEICQRTGVDLLYVCKKSDVEVVLMACYDALKPQSAEQSVWSNTVPAWILGRQKMVRIATISKSQIRNYQKLVCKFEKRLARKLESEPNNEQGIRGLRAKIQKHKDILALATGPGD